MILSRIKCAVSNETGASNLEIIVWMSVVLGIAAFLFAFRNQINRFLGSITERVFNMQQDMENKFNAVNNGLPPLSGESGGSGPGPHQEGGLPPGSIF